MKIRHLKWLFYIIVALMILWHLRSYFPVKEQEIETNTDYEKLLSPPEIKINELSEEQIKNLKIFKQNMKFKECGVIETFHKSQITKARVLKTNTIEAKIDDSTEFLMPGETWAVVRCKK